MQGLYALLADETVRGWYIIFCFAVMAVPMIVLAIWYHIQIDKTSGGRDLMDFQSRLPLNSKGGRGGLLSAFRMMRDISAGKYGKDVRRLQNKTYLLVLVWLVANVIFFGVILLADEANRAAN